MFKYPILAAVAGMSLMAAPALAQAAPQEVELEGTFTQLNPNTNMMNVMGMRVAVSPTTVVMSSTTTRDDLGQSIVDFLTGGRLPGRIEGGFINGTAKLSGTWNAASNRIDATEVLVEPAENVALAVVTDNVCTQANCDGPGDYLRGPNGLYNTPGVPFLPIREPRMAAGPIRDETGFALNLTGVNLRNLGFAAEGYYGTSPVTVNTPTGGTASERAFHYFIFDLVNPAPHLFLNKNRREVSVLRTRCNVGDRWEIRGHVHTTVNAQGVDNDAINSNSGVLSVQYRNAAGQLVRVNGGAATAVPGFGAIGQFRIRFDTPFCPESYTLRWLPTANAADSAAYASIENVGIDRLREDDPEDD